MPQDTIATSAELADLGRARFDNDTAQITDRDTALHSDRPIVLREGRAPKGLEEKVFAWKTFQFTTEERCGREELKGDLHAGLLYRQNRAARGEDVGGKTRGGKDGGGDSLCVGRKGGDGGWPLAKGAAEELEKGWFYEESIFKK